VTSPADTNRNASLAILALALNALLGGCGDLSSDTRVRGDASGNTGDAAPDTGLPPNVDAGGWPDSSSDAEPDDAGPDASGRADSGSDSDALTSDGSSGSDGRSDYDSGITDPGTEGDGDRTIGPGFTAAPETMTRAGVPKGAVISFMLPTGSLFPKAPTREVMVYVPSQYVTGTPAPFMVVQDGTQFYGWIPLLSTVLDNLINAKKVPPIVLVLPSNGGGDSVGSERGLEYDTVSGLYAEWAEKELLPAAATATRMQMPNRAVTFTRDPQGRGAIGGSSGGAASFSMAWWHPDLFTRVLTFSGTYVNQVPSSSPFPHGCWVYHDIDPYDSAAPNGLIVHNCQSATGFGGASAPGPCDTPLSMSACQAVAGCMWNTTVNRPIRIWHESGTNDLGAGGAPSTYRNFDLANQRMAASFKLRGYHYHYDHAIGAGHTDGAVMRQTVAEALIWLWRGYPIQP
jgi:enterochelin esterase-like enzyme